MPGHEKKIKAIMEESSRRLYRDSDALGVKHTPVEFVKESKHTPEFEKHQLKFTEISRRMPPSDVQRTHDIHDFIAHSSARNELSGLGRCEESLTRFMQYYAKNGLSKALPFITPVFFNVQDPKPPHHQNNHCFLMISEKDPSELLKKIDFKTGVGSVEEARNKLINVFKSNPGDNYLVDPYVDDCIDINLTAKGHNNTFLQAYQKQGYVGMASADLGSIDARKINLHKVDHMKQSYMKQFKMHNSDFNLSGSIHQKPGPWKDQFQFPFLKSSQTNTSTVTSERTLDC